MALNTEIARRWMAKTHCDISEGYGLTETSPILSANPLDAVRAGSIGIPLPNTLFKIVNDDGQILPNGEAGELCVKGPQVMQGYWNKPEETAKAFDAEGWFKTGDIAIIEDDGYARIVDRKKDMVIVSGFNVYPNEVEDVAMQHPGILEAAVIGVPTESGNEAIKIFIVRKDLNLTDLDVIAHCKKNLTAYKVPKVVEFRDSLPKTNVGKILRRELRDH
jgi:long-chain acyl-CoA synthetase